MEGESGKRVLTVYLNGDRLGREFGYGLDSTFTRLNYVLKRQSTIVLFHGLSENDEHFGPNGKVSSAELGTSQTSICRYGANALLDAQYIRIHTCVL